MEILHEEIEEAWDEENLCELDKAWDAIHRCLTDGTLDPGEPPLGLAILGGRRLYSGKACVLSLVTSEQLPVVVEALGRIDRDEMRRRYDAMDGYEGPAGDEDFEYTWEYFRSLVEFFGRAQSAGRPVLFTVDL